MTSELLWLAPSWVSNKQALVVLEEKFLQFSLGLLVRELLVEADDGLGDCLADSHDLSCGTTSSHSDPQVEVLEPVSSKQKDGFHGFQPHGGWFECVEGSSIDADESRAFSAVAHSGGVFLSSKGLDALFLFRHYFS